ncbi:MAG: DUF1127 domain-containing protein [Proteobacteria bacterium]|nr:DUF1127 domain-containing protein [Pseudomonadota bacterium]
MICATANSEVDFRGAWREAFAALGAALQASLLAVIVWQERAQARNRLEGLDDAALKDMGLGRADVTREIEKPVWRA